MPVSNDEKVKPVSDFHILSDAREALVIASIDFPPCNVPGCALNGLPPRESEATIVSNTPFSLCSPTTKARHRHTAPQ